MAKRNPVLPGYKALGGSSRNYLTPTGEKISRRKYEDIRLRQFGWDSWADYQKAKKNDDEWLRDVGTLASEQGKKRSDFGPTSEYAQKWLVMRNARRDGGDDLYDPDGPLADYLVYTGKRQPDDWWTVGDTDKIKKG